MSSVSLVLELNMKTCFFLCRATIVLMCVHSLNGAPRDQGRTAVPWQALNRTANETEWTSTSLITNPVSGKVRAHQHKYIELGTGLNYQDHTGAFQPSNPNFVITQNGAEARRGQHQVFLDADLTRLGAVEIITPDGRSLKSAPLAVGYFDPVSGESVLLSAVAGGTGWLTAPNEVIYSNCFANIRASVRYRNSLAGIAQDLILHEQPPSPEAFGLSALSRLEFFTEFDDNTPEPSVSRRVISEQKDAALRQAMTEPDLTDSTITFGLITLGQGKAFAVDAQAQRQRDLPAPAVAKQFTTIAGRKILIESAGHDSLAPLLKQLPPAPLQGVATNAALKHSAPLDQRRPATRALPTQRLAQQSAKAIQMALKADGSSGVWLAGSPAVVIDYEGLNNSSANNKTLFSDVTYLVTGSYALDGTTTIEGGTVIKYAPDASLVVRGTVTCQTSAYRPGVFTSKNDNAVGEIIPGSTGAPNADRFASALYFGTERPAADLKHLRFAYFESAIWMVNIFYANVVTHCQFVHCNRPFYNQNNTLTVRNVLVYDAATVFDGNAFSVVAEHLTARQASQLGFDDLGSGTITLRNSLVVDVSGSEMTVIMDHSRWPVSGTTVFQTVGAGSHYLPANSPYRDAGTLSINAGLLTDLRDRTTTAPNYLTGPLATSMKLGRDVLRDVDALDLGYHYPTIDYLMSGLDLLGSGTTLSLVNGVVVASDFNAATFGMKLTGSHLISLGDPKRMNQLVGANAVQEAPTVAMAASQTFIADTTSGTWPETYYPDSKCRFTAFSQMSAGSHFFNGNYQAGFALRDCQLFGGKIYDQSYAASSPGIQWHNNLFEKVTITVVNASPINFSAHNNTFVGGSVSLHYGDADLWAWGDNIFDGIALTDNGSAIWNSHNAYRSVTGSGLQGAQNTFVMSDTYQVGPLGNRYLPVGSNLRPATGGSITVAQAGLYHHTTLVDQTREAATPLDIGFHYAALNNGVPWDSDADLLADVIEDKNGNNVYDFGESKLNDTDTDDDMLSDASEFYLGLSPSSDESNTTSLRRNYVYNLINRLTSVTGKGKVTITPDKEGNITNVAP